MKINFEVKDKTLIVKIIGEIDHHTAEHIRQKMDDEIIAKMPRKVIMDFSNVNFMDSSGIGVLMGRFKNIQKIDGKMAVASLSDQVRKIFEMSGLARIISVYENIDKAVGNM